MDNETGLDPPGIRVRPVTGLVAADYFAPGYFVWAVLIANLARIGYEEKNMYMAAYDWRISFQNTEVLHFQCCTFGMKIKSTERSLTFERRNLYSETFCREIPLPRRSFKSDLVFWYLQN